MRRDDVYRCQDAIIQIERLHTYVGWIAPATMPAAVSPSLGYPVVGRTLVPLFFLALPLVEIAGFVVVGREIGALATVGLVLLSAVAGAVLMRVQGFGVMARIRRDVAAGRNPGRELAHGVMILFAGILLFIPGFATDIVGLLLFVPPVREFGWRLVRDRVVGSGGFGVFRFRRSGRPDRGRPVIDLDREDYSSARKPGRSPWRSLDGDR